MQAWPVLSMNYGIRPPDVGLYSAAELNAYLDHIEEMNRESRRR